MSPERSGVHYLMAQGVIFTAAITSTFVQRAEREREIEEEKNDAQERERTDARFDSLNAHLGRIEAKLSEFTNT
jgi:uncharacterized protein YPO0396